MTAKPQRTRKSWISTGIEIVLVLFVAVLLIRHFLPARPAPPTAASAVHFTLTTLDGNPIPPTAYQGKAILLNFWAPWCPPCKMEIPWLQKLQNQNPGKLVVVGVVADPTQYARAAAYMRQKGITYPLVRYSPSLESAFGSISELPTSYYISPSMHVVHHVTGLIPTYTMHRYVAEAIHQKQPAQYPESTSR